MGSVTAWFMDSKTGGLNGRFYVLAYFVLAHIFFWKYLVPGQMIFGTDIQNQSYPIQHMAVAEMMKSGSIMLWNPYIFSGMPFLASFSFPFFYPGALLFFIMPLGFAMGYEMVLHFFLMGVFTYALLRQLKLSREAAFVGGLLFMFNVHFVSLLYPGHGGKLTTITFLPLALMYLDRAFSGKALYNFSVLGLLFGVMFYGGHPQILFYCGIALALFFIFHAASSFGKNGLKGTASMAGLFIASGVVGVMLYAAILFPALQYRSYTHRAGGLTGASSYEFATSFSQPPEDLLYVPLRDPFGWGKDYGPKVPTTKDIFYRGRMGLKLSTDYAGVFVLVLAAVGALFVRNRYTWFFAGLALLSMFLALGGFNPLYVYVYKYVPGFSLFRVPYAIMILVPVCWAVLGGFGLQYLLDAGEKKRKGLMPFIYAGSGLSIALIALAYYWRTHAVEAVNGFLHMQWVRQMLWGMYADAVQRFMFLVENIFIFAALLAASMAVLFAYRKGWLRGRRLVLAAAIFIMADLWPVGWDFVKTVPTSTLEDEYYKKTPGIVKIMDDRDVPFRVFSVVTNNELLYWGIEGLTGYHAVLLGYYERALGFLDFSGPLPDLLNAKYLMLPLKPEFDFAAVPDASLREALTRKYELVSSEPYFFYRNRAPLPRAYLVNTLWTANNEDEVLAVVTDRRFEPGKAALIAETPESGKRIDKGADLSGQKAAFERTGTDRLKVAVEAPADSFMVVSEVWYPGWKAYIDGVETKVYRTDYLIRGVFMPAGSHTLTMEFDPPLFKVGAGVSLAALALLTWLIGRGLLPGLRRSGPDNPKSR